MTAAFVCYQTFAGKQGRTTAAYPNSAAQLRSESGSPIRAAYVPYQWTRETRSSSMPPNKSMQGRRMEYIREIVSFIAGAIAGGFAVKVHFSRKSTNQSRNTVGGDMAGRDINKR